MENQELISSSYWFSFWEWIGDKAFLIVVVALAIEFLAARWAKPHRETLDHARELQVAQLTKDASRLSAEAESARAAIASANARAEEARLELARLATPRVKLLTPENVALIAEKISPFAGTKFDVGHAFSGREQWDLLWQLEPIFARAGWVFVDWDGDKFRAFGKTNWTMQPHVYGVANVSNVSIELSPEKRDELLPAATALVGALNGIGIAATVEPHPISGVSRTADAIHFLVGAKE